jgi:hypothetical protein|tara:strand:- start:6192 stop:6416 length:225 start_codon:yes stop_codon:yes gene_type:complete
MKMSKIILEELDTISYSFDGCHMQWAIWYDDEGKCWMAESMVSGRYHTWANTLSELHESIWDVVELMVKSKENE